MIYLPSQIHQTPTEAGVSEMKEISLTTNDQYKILAWYRAPLPKQPTLVYFTGNAGHIGMRGPAVKPYLNQGYGVLLLSYRGYSGNPGRPTEQGLYNDARAAMDYLKQQNIPTSCIILLGESLGSGVAIQIAIEHKVGGIILQSPFTSLGDVAQHHYFYLPAKWLILDKYDSLSKIKKIHAPILVIHTIYDRVIPVKFGKTLFEAANEPKVGKFLEVGNHNNMFIADLAIQFIRKNVYCKE